MFSSYVEETYDWVAQTGYTNIFIKNVIIFSKMHQIFDFLHNVKTLMYRWWTLYG